MNGSSNKQGLTENVQNFHIKRSKLNNNGYRIQAELVEMHNASIVKRKTSRHFMNEKGMPERSN
jgi:hypothetical protein